jgi:hypothetical protein
MKCPRQAEGFMFRDKEYEQLYDPADDTCHHCGSLNPGTFMSRLEAGDISLGATDKSYKVYVHNEGGATLLQHYRDCPREAKCTGPDDCTHWTVRETNQGKFYFQHLSEVQMQRFVDLYNEKKLKMHGGYHFYVAPFFMRFR